MDRGYADLSVYYGIPEKYKMSNELTTVHLVGSLGKAIGVPVWHLDVKSVAEAIRAIDINTRGVLSRYLTGPAKEKMYRIALQKRDNIIDHKEIQNRSGRSTIYIMPTIKGRNSGIGKIVLGIVLIVAAFYTGGASLSWSAGLTTTGWGAIAVGFGVSLILGGITQLLTPRAGGPNASPDQAQSTGFPGTSSAVVQGGCIPVVYGRALVSPIPISITVTNNDVSTSAAGNLGDVIGTPIDGGGTQYEPN